MSDLSSLSVEENFNGKNLPEKENEQRFYKNKRRGKALEEQK